MLRGCRRAHILNSSRPIPFETEPMPVTACDHCGAALGAGTSSAPTAAPSRAGARPAERRQVEALRLATAGHYDIRGELGRGGMATVYLAHDLALDRKVAIKVMSPALAMGDGIERFKREARTAASLSHPNIIPVFGVYHTEDLLYFVMKYVEGRPLDGIIRELGALPIPMVQAILGQVASAFGYAHRHGVIHRDIKPANILIDDEGWAVVTDFGIAKVSDSKGLTMTGLSVGTPTYMSPEQVAGDGVTPASDQYALGVLAYEMLTGKPPFQGANSMAMMYAHVHHPPPPLEAARPDCPAALRDAVMRMLAKDPAERWPTRRGRDRRHRHAAAAHPRRSDAEPAHRAGAHRGQRAAGRHPAHAQEPDPARAARRRPSRGSRSPCGCATGRRRCRSGSRRPASSWRWARWRWRSAAAATSGARERGGRRAGRVHALRAPPAAAVVPASRHGCPRARPAPVAPETLAAAAKPVAKKPAPRAERARAEAAPPQPRRERRRPRRPAPTPASAGARVASPPDPPPLRRPRRSPARCPVRRRCSAAARRRRAPSPRSRRAAAPADKGRDRAGGRGLLRPRSSRGAPQRCAGSSPECPRRSTRTSRRSSARAGGCSPRGRRRTSSSAATPARRGCGAPPA